MTPMLEKVMDAIGAVAELDAKGPALDDLYQRMARAAVLALSEPTSEMVKVGGDAVYNEGGPPTAASNKQADSAYRAMLASVLNS